MTELAALNSSLSFWDAIGVFAAAFVLVGVVLESVTLFEWLKNWSGLAKLPRWEISIGKSGAVLLIVGLAIEIVASTRSHNISEQITAIINNNAAAANERSAILEKEAAALKLELPRVLQPLDQPQVTLFVTLSAELRLTRTFARRL